MFVFNKKRHLCLFTLFRTEQAVEHKSGKDGHLSVWLKHKFANAERSQKYLMNEPKEKRACERHATNRLNLNAKPVCVCVCDYSLKPKLGKYDIHVNRWKSLACNYGLHSFTSVHHRHYGMSSRWFRDEILFITRASLPQCWCRSFALCILGSAFVFVCVVASISIAN